MDVNLDFDIPDALIPFMSPMRYKTAYGGRGSGKSWTIARLLLSRALQSKIRILCARETQKSISESVHKLLKDQIAAMGLDAAFTVYEQKIVCVTGSEFAFAGIRQQGITNLKSYEGVDICWCEEAQVISKRSWDVLIPTIRKPGSEIWVTFNPELDNDETYDRFVVNPPADSITIKCNYSDNPWFPAELEKERIDWLRRDPEGYKTVWGGECRPAVEGAIYAQEITKLLLEKRQGRAPYDPLLKVHTVWDLGWNDSMSIAMVQRSGSGEIRIIDYIEDSHRTLDSYVNELRNKSYNWGTDYIPHDGRSRDFKSGKSTEEMLQAFGRSVFVLGRDDIEEGIKSARMMFGRVWIDEKSAMLLNQLKRYRRTQNQSTGTFGAPLHDDSSHGADCFRYIAMAEQHMTNDTWGEGKLKYPSLNYN
jgi:phage terminase large subunit